MIIVALKKGDEKDQLSAKERLDADLKEAEKIEIICGAWDKTARKVEEQESALERSRAKQAELLTKLNQIGFFAIKEKKKLGGELGELEAEIKGREEQLEKVKKGQHGFASKDDAERRLNEVRKEIGELEKEIQESGFSYSYKDALRALIRNEAFLKKCYAKEPTLLKNIAKTYPGLAACLAASKLMPAFMFGNYANPIEWIVLKKEGNRALLISKNVLDYVRYSDKVRTDVVWATSFLRKWLNNDFLNSAFTDEEKKRLLPSSVPQDENTDGDMLFVEPGPTTTDTVFLLSVSEARKLFASDAERKCEGTPYADGNYKPTSRTMKNTWWLRSPGYDRQHVSCVDNFGSIDTTGKLATFVDIAVRPALWFNLSE